MTLYFDNGTTSFPKPDEVCTAVYTFLKDVGGTSGRGLHKMAYKTEKLLYETRELIVSFFNIPDSRQIVFTSNATEALNIAIKGFLKKGDHVITSSMDHNAVIRPLMGLQKKGVKITVVPAAETGQLDPQLIEDAILKNTRLIAITHSSNVVGTLMPIKEIGDIAQRKGIILLVDAAQSAGKIPIDVEDLKISMMACTGHKGLLGPQGTGFLYVRKGVSLEPLIEGGTGSSSDLDVQPEYMPDKLQSGTINTPGVAGLNAGLKWIIKKGIGNIRGNSISHIKKISESLLDIKGVTVYGHKDPAMRTPVISFTKDGMDPSYVATKLENKYGIVTRVGLHCAPLAHKSIGTYPSGTVRLTPGVFNELVDIDTVIFAIQDICGGK